MKENFKGALVGLAIGDALGATTEFMTKEEVKDRYGYLKDIIGGGWLNLKAGEITDDTEMTLCVANGIIQNFEYPIDKIGEEFIKWFKSKPKDVGISTAHSIRGYNGNWLRTSYESHSLIGKSAGNGSLMRCLPIALAYKDKLLMRKLTIEQSRMTHYDMQAAYACVIYNNIVSKVIEGESLKDAIKNEVNNTDYKNVLNGNLKMLPDGYVVNTFSWVLHVLYNTDNFSDVVETLVNLGEDSDTTAAIAGGLAGLYYGYDSIEDKYKNKLLIRNELEQIADKLYNLRENKKDK